MFLTIWVPTWQPEKGAAVPKFGAWDENNPASAEGFTHIFEKVREERQTGGRMPGPNETPYNNIRRQNPDDSAKVCYRSSIPVSRKQCMCLMPLIFIFQRTDILLFYSLGQFFRAAAFLGAENEVFEFAVNTFECSLQPEFLLCSAVILSVCATLY